MKNGKIKLQNLSFVKIKKYLKFQQKISDFCNFLKKFRYVKIYCRMNGI